jgi:exosome complex protein LRP1
MDTSIVETLLEDLDDNIDDLEEVLGPLIEPSLTETAGKLPVLDRAKLYVLATYSIESLLFCEYPSFKLRMPSSFG